MVNEASDSSPPESNTRRGKGWTKNTPDKRDRSARPLLGAPTSLPAEWYGLMPFLIAAMDQTTMRACVGFAIAAAIMIRQRVLGIYTTAISPMAIYAWARMLGKATKDEKLQDNGCEPRLAMQAISEDGAPSEADWPIDPSQVNVELPWDVEQMASAGRITQWARLDSEGIGLIHDIMHALTQFYPVVFGTFVDLAFEQLGIADSLDTAPVTTSVDLSDLQGGGHMMCIVAYRTNKDGQIEFLVLNSWGLGWCYRGLGWISQAVMLNMASSDFHMMQVTMGNAAKPAPEKAAA